MIDINTLNKMAIHLGGELTPSGYKFKDQENQDKYKAFYERVVKEELFVVKNKGDLSDNVVFLDTETTGLTNTDEVIEIGITGVNGEKLYHETFKPDCESNTFATAKNKLPDWMLEISPKFKNCWGEILSILRNKKVYIYNSNFDVRLISQTLVKQGVNENTDISIIDDICVIDAQAISEKFFGSNKKINQQLAADSLGLTIHEPHSALGDASMLCVLINELNYQESHADLKAETLKRFKDFSSKKKDEKVPEETPVIPEPISEPVSIPSEPEQKDNTIKAAADMEDLFDAFSINTEEDMKTSEPEIENNEENNDESSVQPATIPDSKDAQFDFVSVNKKEVVATLQILKNKDNEYIDHIDMGDDVIIIFK